jgi:hypothetical protein
MTDLKQIVAELREKRLWPVALALLVALVAVPVLLSKSPSQTPVAALPQSAATAAPPATAVPAVSVQTAATRSNLKGRGHDPFRQQKLPTAGPKATTTTAPSTGTAAAPAGGSTASAGTGAAGSGSTSTGSSGGSPTSGTLPRVLYYRFATSLSFGRVGGHRRAIKDVNKFTPLPSAANPVAVFLGLRNDARTAVFLLSSSASATGKGTCHPSRWSCTFLYVQVGQRELLLTQGEFGHIAQYELDLTRIHPVPTGAPTSATAASTHVSSAGRQIIRRAAKSLPALRSLTYSTKTGLMRFMHGPAVWLVHVGRLASASVAAVGAANGRGPR